MTMTTTVTPSVDTDTDTENVIPLDVVVPTVPTVPSWDVDNAHLNGNVWGAQGWNNPADTDTATAALPDWDTSGADLNDLPVLDGYGPACPSCRVLTALATWHCFDCDVTVPRTAATRGPVAPPAQSGGPFRGNAPEILDHRGNSGGTRLRCVQAGCLAQSYDGGMTCKTHSRGRVTMHTYA